MKNSHQIKIAFSLSAFILPGLGQLHLKKRIKGWIMILLCFLDIILMFGKFLMGILLITQNSPHKREFSHLTAQFWQAAVLQKEWLIGGLLLLVCIWIWSAWDIWKEASELETKSAEVKNL